jgi:hypothetical protein
MSVATMNERIGAASHWRRNLWLVGAVIAAGVGIAGFYAAYSRTDANELGRLERFRAAIAEKCDAPEFADPSPPVLKDLYLTSQALRDAVDRQQIALDAGASCDSIFRALRAADFPMPLPPEARPIVHVQP